VLTLARTLHREQPPCHTPGSPASEADYEARWGYRTLDARRYEARRYGNFVGRVRLRLLVRALRCALAGLPAGALVLDVPCGTGVVSHALVAQGFRVVGMDISPSMLAVAGERGEGRGHVRADLEEPPIRPASVDAVVCVRFLMHVPQTVRPRVLAALAQMTYGPLVATVSHPYTLKTLKRSVRQAFGWPAKPSRRLDRPSLAAEAKAAGLQLERVIPAMPLFSDVWVAVMTRPTDGKVTGA
jgi:SAM-dependent methyltransferase